jgi:hypothetical protein
MIPVQLRLEMNQIGHADPFAYVFTESPFQYAVGDDINLQGSTGPLGLSGRVLYVDYEIGDLSKNDIQVVDVVMDPLDEQTSDTAVAETKLLHAVQSWAKTRGAQCLNPDQMDQRLAQAQAGATR